MEPVISVGVYVVTEDCYAVINCMDNMKVFENGVIQTQLSKLLPCQTLRRDTIHWKKKLNLGHLHLKTEIPSVAIECPVLSCL